MHQCVQMSSMGENKLRLISFTQIEIAEVEMHFDRHRTVYLQIFIGRDQFLDFLFYFIFLGSIQSHFEMKSKIVKLKYTF